MNDWRLAHKLGLFFILLLILCFIWYAIHPVQRELHMGLFEVSFYGFSGMNVVSFILAAVQVYIWGYIFVGLWGIVEKLSKKS